MNDEDQELFLEMLLKLDGSHESIKAASKWCRFHFQHHEDITKMWFFAVAKARTKGRRLDLFHLVSDILFTADANSVQYFSSFLPQLIKAIPLVRGDEIKLSMAKLFSLWREKKIYNKAVMLRLYKLLQNGNKVVDKRIFRYDRTLLFKNLRRVDDLNPACDYFIKELENSTSFENSQIVNKFKDQTAGKAVLSAVDSHKTKVTSLVSYLEEMTHLLQMTTCALDIAGNKESNGIEELLLKIKAYSQFTDKVKCVSHRLNSGWVLNDEGTTTTALTPASPDPEDNTMLFSRRDNSVLNLEPPPSPFLSVSNNYWNTPRSRGALDDQMFHRRGRGSMTPLRDEPAWFPSSPSYTDSTAPLYPPSSPANMSYAGSQSPARSLYADSENPGRGMFAGPQSPSYAGPSNSSYAGPASPSYAGSASPSYSGSSSWGAPSPFRSGPVYQKWYTGISQTADCSSPRPPPLLPTPAALLPKKGLLPTPSPSSLPSLLSIPFTTFMNPSSNLQK